MTNAIFLAISLTAPALWAGPLSFPVLTPDSQDVRTDAPQWSQPIIAAPNLVAMVWWSDNFRTDPICTPRGHGCDLDGNDAVATVSYDATGSSYMLSYFAGVTEDLDYLRAPGGLWLHVGQSGTYSSTPGGETILELLNKSTGDSYFSGDKVRNSDGSKLHEFLVTSQPDVPEPGTLWLFSAAFAECVLLRVIKAI